MRRCMQQTLHASECQGLSQFLVKNGVLFFIPSCKYPTPERVTAESIYYLCIRYRLWRIVYAFSAMHLIPLSWCLREGCPVSMRKDRWVCLLAGYQVDALLGSGRRVPSHWMPLFELPVPCCWMLSASCCCVVAAVCIWTTKGRPSCLNKPEKITRELHRNIGRTHECII